MARLRYGIDVEVRATDIYEIEINDDYIPDDATEDDLKDILWECAHEGHFIERRDYDVDTHGVIWVEALTPLPESDDQFSEEEHLALEAAAYASASKAAKEFFTEQR